MKYGHHELKNNGLSVSQNFFGGGANVNHEPDELQSEFLYQQ